MTFFLLTKNISHIKVPFFIESVTFKINNIIELIKLDILDITCAYYFLQ